MLAVLIACSQEAPPLYGTPGDLGSEESDSGAGACGACIPPSTVDFANPQCPASIVPECYPVPGGESGPSCGSPRRDDLSGEVEVERGPGQIYVSYGPSVSRFPVSVGFGFDLRREPDLMTVTWLSDLTSPEENLCLLIPTYTETTLRSGLVATASATSFWVLNQGQAVLDLFRGPASAPGCWALSVVNPELPVRLTGMTLPVRPFCNWLSSQSDEVVLTLMGPVVAPCSRAEAARQLPDGCSIESAACGGRFSDASLLPAIGGTQISVDLPLIGSDLDRVRAVCSDL